MSEEDQVTEEQTGEEGAPEAPEVNETEARAREAGWRPKEEFRGDPDEWVPAEEWLDYTPGKLRKQNRTLEREIGAMRRSLDVVARRQEEMRKRAYDDAYKDIQTRQREAAQDGDMDRYEKLEQEREKLEKPNKDQTPPQGADGIDPAIKTWADQNPWIVNDPVHFAEAQFLARQYERAHPTEDLSARLNRISVEMGRRHSGTDTPAPKPKRPAMAETTTRGPGRSANKKVTFADLTQEEKAAVYELERRQQIGAHDDALFKSRDDYAQHLRSYYKEDV